MGTLRSKAVNQRINISHRQRQISLFELEEARNDLKDQSRSLVACHKPQIEVLQRDRKLVGNLPEVVDDDDNREETRKGLEELRLQQQVNELEIQLKQCNSLKEDIETIRSDLKAEQQAHETTKRMAASKMAEMSEMQKYKLQTDEEIYRLRNQLQHLTAAKEAADIHNSDLQMEQHRLRRDNTEGLKQVQYLHSQVMAKDEEVQKYQRIVEEVRRQMREMKQERQVLSFGQAERVSKVPLRGLYQHTQKGSGSDPRDVPHQQPKQLSLTADDYQNLGRPIAQPPNSELYGPSSVLGRDEYAPLQEWMKREHVMSTIQGRSVHATRQPSNSLVKPTFASSYSSSPLPMNSGSQSPQPPKPAHPVPVQPVHPTQAQGKHPQKSDKALECPRCQKPFSAADFSNYREHLEQCLT